LGIAELKSIFKVFVSIWKIILSLFFVTIIKLKYAIGPQM